MSICVALFREVEDEWLFFSDPPLLQLVTPIQVLELRRDSYWMNLHSEMNRPFGLNDFVAAD